METYIEKSDSPPTLLTGASTVTGARLAALILSRAEAVEAAGEAEDVGVDSEVDDAVSALANFDTLGFVGGVLGTETLGDFMGDSS